MTSKNTYEVALQTVMVELLKAIASQTKRTPKFRTLLKRLDETLSMIEPVLNGSGRLTRVLDRSEKETKVFVNCVENGKETVLKCSRIKCWNVYKKFVHANKLICLDNELWRFFQAELQDNLSAKMKSLALVDEVDQVISTITKIAGGCASSSNVPGLLDLIVGLDFHLNELKRVLLKNDSNIVTICAPEGCGKTSLAKMLCRDNEIKDNISKNALAKMSVCNKL